MKRFTAETFAGYRYPSSPLISPDGKLTGFCPDRDRSRTQLLPRRPVGAGQRVGQRPPPDGAGRRLCLCLDAGRPAGLPARRGEELKAAREAGKMLTRYFVIDPRGGEAEFLCALPIEGGRAPHPF